MFMLIVSIGGLILMSFFLGIHWVMIFIWFANL